jgi:hypothetical protein
VIVDDPAGISAGWLTEVLQSAGVDASVRDVAVSPVGTGQMASCVRLDVTYERGDGPATLVAKLPSPDPEVRRTGATTYRTEVHFYRDLAPSLPVAVPRCYLAVVTDDGTAFTLLLEDMAPATAGDQLGGCTPAQAEAAAIAVAGLHGGSWCDRATRALDWLIPPVDVLAAHIEAVFGDVVETFLGHRALDDATTAVLRRYAKSFASWATGRSGPWSLLHNDYRLDNLLFAPDDAPAPGVTTVDWQSLTTGPPLRDVAFLLGSGLDPVDRRAHERDIVGTYHDRLASIGVEDYDAEQCWDDYRHALFHGLFICVMGEAFSKPTERGRQMFTVMAERSAVAIDDLDSFALVDEEAHP